MGSRVKVLTWNIWNYNNWEARKGWLMHLLASLKPDIVALQEIRYKYLEGPNQAEELAEGLCGYHLVVQPAAVETRHWEGLAVFSKLPVVKVNYWGLSRDLGDPDDAPHQRIVLGVQLDCGGESLCLFNSHWSLSRNARLRTAQEALEFIAAFAKDNKRIVLLGDFNALPEEEAVTVLRESCLGLKDAWESACGDAPGGTWEVPTPQRRIDYIFYGPGLSLLSCERVGLLPNKEGVYASDHAGLLAEFEVS
ncbi:MAG TPA: hypothetical protein GXX47_05545 [Firmicutes bacterium]|nr:hypothetical protein [Bacillota bacterium]